MLASLRSARVEPPGGEGAPPPGARRARAGRGRQGRRASARLQLGRAAACWRSWPSPRSSPRSPSSGGGGDSKADAEPPTARRRSPRARPRTSTQAVKAAGCDVQDLPERGPHAPAVRHGGQHNYKTNPPTSGDHSPMPAQDGVYAPGNSPAKENFVHTLEHGRIEFQYSPGRRRRSATSSHALQREVQGRRRLPHAAVREQHEHALRGRRDRVDAPRSAARRSTTRRGTRCAPSATASSTRARSSSRRPGRGPSGARADRAATRCRARSGAAPRRARAARSSA